jgi:mono/diheme cytochrome c family protein
MTLNLSSRTLRASLVLALGLASLPALSMRKEEPRDARAAAAQADAAQRPASPERGQIKFKQNCSRCHEAPQGFSSRISGTIVRHMRVRASLSAQDERDILRFLNP